MKLYENALSDLRDDVRLLTETEGKKSSYHLLVAIISGGGKRRKRVFDYLQTQNIRAQIHYIPVHFQPWYQERFGFQRGDFPHAENYYESCISLPLYPAMNEADVERVAMALRAALK